MEKKTIVFDYDGVIIDSFASLYNCYKIICDELGVDFNFDIEEFRKIYGYSYKECYINLGVKKGDYLKASNIYSREIVKQNSEIFDDIIEVLEKLSEKYDLVLISATFLHEVEDKINKYGLNKYFSKIYAVEEVGTSKKTLIEKFIADRNLDSKNLITIGDRNIDYDTFNEIGFGEIYIVDYGWGYDPEKIPNKDYSIKEPKDIMKYL
jgi:phosphoglycolate phosphatase